MGARWRAGAQRIIARSGYELIAVTLAVLPIAVAFVRSVTRRWIPVGDAALVEIRARDVFSARHFPLLGTWSSASRAAGKDLNHPGPLLFDVLAVPVRLFGGPVGVALGVALINACAVVGVAVAARRIAGTTASLVATTVAATLSWTLGSELLISPWNPHVLILPALCLLVLAWGVAAGDLALAPWTLAVGSFCLQTHVGYAYLVPAIVLLAIAGAAAVRRSRWRKDAHTRPGDVLRLRRWSGVSVVTVLVLWAQPLWEQLTGAGEGNLSRLVTSSGGDEQAIGLSLGARLTAGVVALPPWWTRPSFMEAVPFTPYAADGVTLRPQGLPSVGLSVLALTVVLALLVVAVLTALRRRDRPAFVGGVVAAAVLVTALATFAIVPVGTLGLTAHQMRWLWALGAFVVLALLVGVARATAMSSPRAQAAVRGSAVAVIAIVGLLNLPWHVHRDGPAAAPEAQAAARSLSSQLDDYEPGPGGVVFESDNLRFTEPYSTVIMSALQRNGIDFFVEDHGLIRQFGESRRFDGSATTRLFMLEDRPALDAPPGAELVALASPLSAEEIDALLTTERQLIEQITATGLVLTESGADAVASGTLGVTADEVAAAATGAERLVVIGAIARLTQTGALVLAPEDEPLFRRHAELRAQVDLRTVAIYAEPVS